jgi:CheY-like chemotaxis protein
MPDMDGMAVARQVRARQDARPLLVALTGWGQRQDMLDTAEAGFDHHLTKPVDIMQIVPLLKNAQPRRPRAE